MADTGGRAVLRRVMEQMRADPAVLQEMVDAARAGSAPVAALPEQEVKRHIAALVSVVAGAFIEVGGLTEEQARSAAWLAADRAAQGVPLAALLDGFQAARTQAFRSIAARLQDTAMPFREFLDLLVELDSYAAGLQTRLIAAYHETRASLAAGSRAARLEALRELLVEGAVHRLTDAGLQPEARYHLLVADTGDPQRARRAEADLATGDSVSGLVQGHLCVVSSRPHSRSDGRLELSVTAPAVVAAELPTAYRLCRAALAAARQRDLVGERRLLDLTVPIAMHGVPEMGLLLSAELLAGLDRADPLHRLLAVTALTYLDHGRRIDRTARALHVHPNTVKHRLRRLAELTAFAAGSVADELLDEAFRWRWALESWLVADP